MSMNTWPLNAPLGLLPQGMDIPLPTEDTTPVRYAEIVGDAYLAFVSIEDRKKGGYYLTPGNVARFMAERASCAGPGLHVLDPGSGTGILAAAVCEMASTAGSVQTLHVDAYETDPLLASLTHLVLAFSNQWLGERGVTLTFDVKREDFVLKNADVLRATRRLDGCPENAEAARSGYDLVISNPPYFKLSKSDPRAVAAGSIVHGQPNIYALFMAVSAELLSESGELVYIVPRSFSSGPYFRKFREAFFQRVAPKAIHLFESRSDVFKRQSVLQENLILTGRNRINGTLGDEEVLISHSETSREMPDRPTFMVSLDSVLNLAGKNKELGIPLIPQDVELVDVVRSWPNTLHSLGLDISTGPVVPFRARGFLARADSEGDSVPLLWMSHVRPMRIQWPLTGKGPPQWILVAPGSVKLLVDNATYVLVRRFSAKEEERRLVAAPLLGGHLGLTRVGFENHLNYIRGVSRELDDELAWGLAAILNSSFLDRYFRVFNGNTQVSATELRAMPLPDESAIRAVGGGVGPEIDPGTVLTEVDLAASRVLKFNRD